MSANAEISLFEAFKQVQDPRKRRGIRHPFHALLTLAATAFLAGARSVNALGDFGRDHPELAEPLGFTRDPLPCQGTFHYLFKALDIDAFEAALRVWALALGDPDAARRIAHIDGKSLRGSKRCANDCVHLLSAYCDQTGAVLAQIEVGEKTNEPKAALELLRLIPMKGTVVTGDAIFAQRDLSEQIVNEGGDYFWTVKDNQKTLRTEIDNAFDAEALPPRATSKKG
jgi:DDE_Tnp_1-associated/Transposase DDE domain